MSDRRPDRGPYRVPPARVRGNDWKALAVDDLESFTPTHFASVVIPYYERPEELQLTLAGLERQTYPRELFEVVVVDDGSDPPLATPETSLDLRVEYQEDLGFGLARARNTGARASAGDIVLFLDCDMIPEDGWLAAHARWHHTASDALTMGFRFHVEVDGIDAAAVRGRSGTLGELFEGREATRPEWIEIHLARMNELTSDDDDLFRVITGGNFGISRSFFEVVGGFDETFTQWGAEDREFAYRAYTLGSLLVPEREALCWHQGPGATHSDEERYSLGLQFAKMSQLVAHPVYRRGAAGRTFTVPQHVVTLRHADTTVETILANAEELLASKVGDLVVWIEERPADGSYVWLRRLLEPDPRVFFGAADGAMDRFPVASFHITMDAGSSYDPGMIGRLRAGLGSAASGTATFTEGAPVTIVRSWAWHRAHRAGVDISEVGRAVEFEQRNKVPEDFEKLELIFTAGLKELENTLDGRLAKLERGTEGSFNRIDSRFTRLENKTDGRFTRLENKTDGRFNQMGGRLKKIDGRFTRLENKTDGRFTRLENRTDGRFNQISGRFNQMGGRLKKIDGRLNKANSRFTHMNRRFNRMDRRFDRMDRRFDKLEKMVSDTFMYRMLQRSRWVGRVVRRVISEAVSIRSPYDARLFVRWFFESARRRITKPEPPPPLPPPPPPETEPVLRSQAAYSLGADIVAVGPRAETVFAGSQRVRNALVGDVGHPNFPFLGGRHVDLLVVDSPPLLDGLVQELPPSARVLKLSEGSSMLSVPAFDPEQVNPIGWRADHVAEVASLGPPAGLPEGVPADHAAGAGDPESLRYLHHVEDIAGYHDDPVGRAATLAELGASGVLVHLADHDPDLERHLGTELYRLMAADEVVTADRHARESISIAMRREALRTHSLRSRARHTLSEGGVDGAGLPEVSVLLATRRPHQLRAAVQTVARQTYPRLELVLGFHGEGFDSRSVAVAVEGFDHPTRMVRVDAAQPLGAVLNATVAASSGVLLTKMDDDDAYGDEHIWDLVLAHEYSCAELVAKASEYVYLSKSDKTVRLKGRHGERYIETRSVSGGVVMISRHDLAYAGGWRRLPRQVDLALAEDVLRSGGRIYWTHGAGYTRIRHGGEHTWKMDDDFFLRRAGDIRKGHDLSFAGI